jgi:hypothetical protein
MNELFEKLKKKYPNDPDLTALEELVDELKLEQYEAQFGADL